MATPSGQHPNTVPRTRKAAALPQRCLRAAVLVAAACTLAACANMTTVPPGTPVSQVEAKYGQPNYSCPLPDGGKRLIWTMQPAGQYAWGTNVDAAGDIDHIAPLLTDKHFEVLAKGVWTPEKVRCEFGPPAKNERVGLPSVQQTVWSYRYKQYGVWNSFMYVYFGKDGSHVTRFHPGPDLSYEHWPFFD